MKKAILIAKGGGVFYTRKEAAKNSTSGEQGETEGIIRYLVAHPDVTPIYYGQYRGEHLCDVFEPDIRGITEQCAGCEQTAAFERDYMRFMQEYFDHDVIGFINVSGYSPTFSHIDNPNWATVQAAAVRYTAPMLDIIQRLKIPRIVVNNDPRTYPRDQEMAHDRWSYSRPAALLDQREKRWDKVVGGKKFKCHSVYAAPESWAHHDPRENTNRRYCTMIAHAHLHDGIRVPGRERALRQWLHREYPLGFEVWGKGWERYEHYEPEIYPGVLKPDEVLDVLNETICCPVIAHEPGFYTGKIYVLVAQGCIPLLYGRGDEYTYDPLEKILPLNSPFRFDSHRGFLDAVERVVERQSSLRDFWKKACEPRWEVLTDLIDDLLVGRDMTTESWFDDYGGYFPK